MQNPPDTLKVRILNQLAWEFRGLQMLRALEYGKQALDMATKLGMYEEMMNSYNFIGVIYRNMGNYTQAMSSYLRALELAEQYKNDKQIAYCHNNIGNLYMKQKQYKQALEHCLRALAAFERLSDKRGTAYAHLRIGEIYERQHHNDQAIEHYQESLRLRRELGDSEGLITPLTSIATIYRTIGQDSLAFLFYQQSLAIERELHHDKGLAGTLVGLGLLYMNKQQYDKAIASAEESLYHARKASAVEEEAAALKLLTQAYSQRRDYAKAFQWQQAFLHLRDSLYNEETSSRIASLRAEYEAEKRAAEIELLQHNRQMQYWMLTGSGVALLVFIVLSIILFRLNKQRRKMNTELRLQFHRTEEERQRSDALLLNILPEAIAQRMKAGETTIAEYFDSATVLFADIVGFTNLAARLNPRDLIAMLDTIFSELDTLAERYKLEKIKTIGDSYMVVGGVPQPCPDHAHRVAMFAIHALDS
ncbi:MAG: tetratricopeptide repeat protein, partial [Bacteroidota bacterium]|nr:tetratricopeptide repeat protein [Bacteroidota bacterium]